MQSLFNIYLSNFTEKFIASIHCFNDHGNPNNKKRQTRSTNSTNATQLVPGNNTLAANLMARAWNSSTELHTVTTVGAAKVIARKWAQNLLVQ
jgi:hypothetical protein